jgi:uncharacterized protein YbjT (DUF2867 family)
MNRKFAALAFENPENYIGQGIELAGDEMTEPEIVKVFAKVIGKQINLVPPSGPPPNEDMEKMVAWFNEKGYESDIPALRSINEELMTLETWLRNNNW